MKKTLLSNHTQCFLVSFVFTVLTIVSKETNNTAFAYWFMLFVLIPAPLYFAAYGAIRQGVYKKNHHLLIRSLVIAGTSIVIYSMYYVISTIAMHNINNIYWQGFGVESIQLAAMLSGGFVTGSLVIKIIQFLMRRFPKNDR